MDIESDDIELAVNIINEAWIKSVESTITDKDLLVKVKASAGLNIMRGFLEFAEKEVEKELGLAGGAKEAKPGLTPEEVAELREIFRKDNG